MAGHEAKQAKRKGETDRGCECPFSLISRVGMLGTAKGGLKGKRLRALSQSCSLMETESDGDVVGCPSVQSNHCLGRRAPRMEEI